MSNLPKVTIRGGPVARTIEVTQDGVPMKGIVKFVLRADMKDVVFLYTKQIVEVDLDMEVNTAEGVTHGSQSSD